MGAAALKNACGHWLAYVYTVAGNHDRWLLTDQQRHVRNAHCRARVSDQGQVFLESLPKVICLNTAGGELRLCHGVAEDDMAGLHENYRDSSQRHWMLGWRSRGRQDL